RPSREAKSGTCSIASITPRSFAAWALPPVRTTATNVDSALAPGSKTKLEQRISKLEEGMPPPVFFVRADSKGVTGAFCVRADSKGLASEIFVKTDSEGLNRCWRASTLKRWKVLA